MKNQSLSLIALLLLFISAVLCFKSLQLSALRTLSPIARKDMSLLATGKSSTSSKSNSKGVNENVDTSQFWQGEWVCADCGYIYDREYDGDGLYFEQQPRGFVCPQCSAPRKRYAKKVGDQWGVTRDGGDLPIYAFTFGGLALVIWFSFFYVPQL